MYLLVTIHKILIFNHSLYGDKVFTSVIFEDLHQSVYEDNVFTSFLSEYLQ
jgi:hypothetical protein